MALTRTTLAAACTASDTTLSVTSTTGFPAVGTVAGNQPMQIDGEMMFAVGVPASGIVKVRGRGSEGTLAVAHDILADIETSSNPADFPAVPIGAVSPRPPYVDDVITIGQNGAIACPNKNTTYLINKATALASSTLAQPTTAQNGLRLTFTSMTAAAHVITSVMEDGTTGGSTTATYAAFIGATMVLKAANAIWNVESVQLVTIT